MDTVSLTLNVLGLVFGSGALLALWNGGKRMGEIEVQLKNLVDEPESISTSEVDRRIAAVRAEMVKDIHDSQQAFTSRINDIQSMIQEAMHGIGAGTESIKSIRRDWDSLNNELRHLLRSEATGTADISTLKDRVSAIDHKVTELLQKVASSLAQIENLRDDRAR